MNATVYIEALKQTGSELADQFDRSALAVGLTQQVKSLKAILIKPNLTFPVYKEGVTTRAEFVRELVRTLLRIKPNLKIFIGEGEGGYNSFSMSDAMRRMGFAEICRANNLQGTLHR